MPISLFTHNNPLQKKMSLFIDHNIMPCQESLPEKTVRVQSLSGSTDRAIPIQYVKSPSKRPSSIFIPTNVHDASSEIPVIDIQSLLSEEEPGILQEELVAAVGKACKEWGFFQVVNHGVDPQLMAEFREEWRGFFYLPMEEKEACANSKWSEEGYGTGSKFGRGESAHEDWNDNYFLHLLPAYMRDLHRWPKRPSSLRQLIEKYGEALAKLSGKLMKTLSKSLGLEENRLSQVLGGEKHGAYLRVNFYPKCPEPELTLGASSHSDPSALTLLLADDKVSGLQLLKDGCWIPVEPAADAFIVNIGDQIEVLSNGRFKSSEHRVVVNSDADRISIAYFYNPERDLTIGPIKELITNNSPALYFSQTYDDYIDEFADNGLSGKSLVASRKVLS